MLVIGIDKLSDGIFFNAQTPDVYSGLRISYEVEKYPFLLYPITISGVSSYSNGIATFTTTSSKIGNEFLKLNNTFNYLLYKYYFSNNFKNSYNIFLK